MTKSEFYRATIDWANAILDQPCYVMPNGKPSHAVAHETLAQTIDESLEDGSLRISSNGKFII